MPLEFRANAEPQGRYGTDRETPAREIVERRSLGVLASARGYDDISALLVVPVMLSSQQSARSRAANGPAMAVLGLSRDNVVRVFEDTGSDTSERWIMRNFHPTSGPGGITADSESCRPRTHRAPSGPIPSAVGLLSRPRNIWDIPLASPEPGGRHNAIVSAVPTYRTHRDHPGRHASPSAGDRIEGPGNLGNNRGRRLSSGMRWAAVRTYVTEEFQVARLRVRRAMATASKVEFWNGRVWVVAVVGGLLGLTGVLIGLLVSSTQQASLPIPVASSETRSAVAPPPAMALTPSSSVESTELAQQEQPEAKARPASKPVAKPRTAERRAQSRDAARTRELAEDLIGSWAGGFSGAGR